MEPLLYHLELPNGSYPIARVVGSEGMSASWRFDIELPAETPALDPDAVVRAAGALSCFRGGVPVRRLVGVVTDVSVQRSRRGAPATVVLESPLALLRFRRDVQIFRDRTAPEIVVEMLAKIGVEPLLRLAESYPRRPYCVQWRETDWAFVHRLLEDEGIFYFFDAGSRLVLGDRAGAYGRLPPAPFRPSSGLLDQHEVVVAVDEIAELTVGRVSLRDFNPRTPDLDMDVTAPASGSPSEHYDFPGGYAEPAQGRTRAAVLAEAFTFHAEAFAGQSTVAALAPGHVLALSDAPPGVPPELLVTRLEHDWDRGRDGFHNRFEAHPAEATYRPRHVTPRPRISNHLTGFAAGPAGVDIHCDDRGYVKVWFPWDRKLPADDRCSDWVPVLQDNTGSSCNIPRTGWEVLVGFTEGDPDRPVVLGRMYNGADPFPETLPANKTRTALRSLSSPTRDGHNMIRFDDAAGSEQLKIHAEKDEVTVVANDKQCDVCNDESRSVIGDESLSVGADQSMAIGGGAEVKINGNQRLVVGGSRNLRVGATRQSRTGGDHSLSIGGSHQRKAGTDDSVSAKTIHERVGALVLEASFKSNSTFGKVANSYLVGAAALKVCGKSCSYSADRGRFEAIGGLLVSQSGQDTSAKTDGVRTMKAGAAMTLDAGGSIGFSAKSAFSASAATLSVSADTVTLKVGSSCVVLGDGAITVSAEKIILTARGNNVDGAGEAAEN